MISNVGLRRKYLGNGDRQKNKNILGFSLVIQLYYHYSKYRIPKPLKHHHIRGYRWSPGVWYCAFRKGCEKLAGQKVANPFFFQSSLFN